MLSIQVHTCISSRTEQVESGSGRGHGKIISILTFGALNPSGVQFHPPLYYVQVFFFNHWLVSLQVLFLGDLTPPHFLMTTKTLSVLSETSALTLAGLVFRFS